MWSAPFACLSEDNIQKDELDNNNNKLRPRVGLGSHR